MISKPSKYLIIMNVTWIAPFFIQDVFMESFSFSSYLTYLTSFFCLALVIFVINSTEVKFNFWQKLNFVSRLIVLNAIYASNVVITVEIISVMDEMRVLGFFGGDAAGSYLMLYYPSILLALPVSIIILIIEKFCKKKTNPYKILTSIVNS